MSSTSLEAAPTATTADPNRYRQDSKTDQWICWWSMPVFYTLFGIIFVVLARVMPPPRPDVTTPQIVGFFHEHALTIKIGFVLLMIVIGFSTWANGLVAHHMKRMSVGSGWAYAYLAALSVGAIPGCLFAAFCFLAAVFRPDRNPHIVVMLYDMGLLFFVGSLGCFITMYLVFALAILLDKNRIFPQVAGVRDHLADHDRSPGGADLHLQERPVRLERCDQLLAGDPDLRGMAELSDPHAPQGH